MSQRVQLSVRVDQSTHDKLHASANEVGFEGSVVARAMIEAALARVDAGENLLDVLQLLKSAPRAQNLRRAA